MKNPNGYGSIAKLSGNRRKPYIIRKTTGYNDKGYPIYKIIGYTTTKEEALQLLANYNHSPYDVNLHKLTAQELFQMFAQQEFNKMASSSVQSLKAAWKHCKIIYTLKYKDLKAFHMQECIDKCPRSYSSAPSAPETTKQPFTLEEVEKLWTISKQDWVDSILILIYMGWRISELLSIKSTDIDLINNTIIGGTKTKSGKNRIVPIHSRILPLIQNRVQQNNTYLFGNTDKACNKITYYRIWYKIMQQLHLTHTPHECRHTFRTLLDNTGAIKFLLTYLWDINLKARVNACIHIKNS